MSFIEKLKALFLKSAVNNNSSSKPLIPSINLISPELALNDESSGEVLLTDEQTKFVDIALSGKNILVDACIGSGKTTAIQHLCNFISPDKRVLYLTYNRLLKKDAQDKIKNANVHVQNYHGYAYEHLKEIGITTAQSDLLCEFNRRKLILPPIDILVIDEYQDIDSMSAEMLIYIKTCYPQIQIIMVGDMEQKIYDHTTLNVKKFAADFLEEYQTVNFKTCFRISAEWANELGKTWKKTIIGSNENCEVCEMSLNEVADFLIRQNPKDILCLGSRSSKHNYGELLNILESEAPDKFNKNTVYASIRDEDANIRSYNDCAIFTTFDSSKGLERDICVLMDWTNDYWRIRQEHSQSYEILRNIFCVAASRGKQKIIIVKFADEETLSWDELRTYFTPNTTEGKKFDPSRIFEFAKQEYIDKCYSYLEIKPLNTNNERLPIEIPRADGLIDLSPCIGIYQEAMYFDNYDIDQDLCLHRNISRIPITISDDAPLMEKILYLTSIETGQDRYRKQVDGKHLVSKEQWEQIASRLHERLKKSEKVQEPCNILCEGLGNIIGLADVVKDKSVYELKFVSELSRANFLQCAVYTIGLDKEVGILWNILDNKIYEIRISSKRGFLDALVSMLSDGSVQRYAGPLLTKNNEGVEKAETGKPNISFLTEDKEVVESKNQWLDIRRDIVKDILSNNEVNENDCIAVIDIETTFDNNDIISIGSIIADATTMQPIRMLYYIIIPECTEGGMFSNALKLAPKEITKTCSRQKSINELKLIFKQYKVNHIFAYNASFDFQHLPELNSYQWHDIMSKAAYLNDNPFLNTENGQYYSTGRLKSGYGVENIFRIITGDPYFQETHNALYDAIDELQIMQKIKCEPYSYLLLGQKKKHPK